MLEDVRRRGGSQGSYMCKHMAPRAAQQGVVSSTSGQYLIRIDGPGPVPARVNQSIGACTTWPTHLAQFYPRLSPDAEKMRRWDDGTFCRLLLG